MNEPTKKDEIRNAAIEALADFEKAETDRSNELLAGEAKKQRAKKFQMIAQWILLLVCLVVIVFQLPRLMSLSQSTEKPFRHGPQATDERTDLCIQKLWEIAHLIQQGKPVPDSIVDPASGKPYLAVQTGDDVIVKSPNPELYGFRVIRVSKKNPVPELIK